MHITKYFEIGCEPFSDKKKSFFLRIKFITIMAQNILSLIYRSYLKSQKSTTNPNAEFYFKNISYSISINFESY